MSFGFGNYMVAYAMRKWRNDFTVLFPEGFSFLLFWLIYHMSRIKGRLSSGKSFWERENSVYFDSTYH